MNAGIQIEKGLSSYTFYLDIDDYESGFCINKRIWGKFFKKLNYKLIMLIFSTAASSNGSGVIHKWSAGNNVENWIKGLNV